MGVFKTFSEYFGINFKLFHNIFIRKQNIFFRTSVDQDFLTTKFHSSKSCFFLVSTSGWVLIHCEKPKIQQFPGVL
jgi:hypothetical protein